MRKSVLGLVAALAIAVFATPALATNGDNIIGVGAISRSMGGTGVAAPQDAITAVFGNPAAMCYIPCETSEVDFAATVFVPAPKASFTWTNLGNPFMPSSFTASGVSRGAPYAFPAIGIYVPINENLKFGLAAYGVSGLGVDYKESDLASVGNNFSNPTPGAQHLPATDIKTDLQIMKFAPNVAYRVMPNLSVGAALQVNWAQLDLGDGGSHTFGFGTQLGVSYKPVEPLSIGLTYQTEQLHGFRRITNFNPVGISDSGFVPSSLTDSKLDTLKLAQPQQVVLGVAYDIIPKKLLVEVDGKWINWSGATGYKDFDWVDQYVVAVGLQAKPMDWLAVRLGYNYGNNPVRAHNGWTPGGAVAGAPNSTSGVVNVQGTPVDRFFYEYLRIVGFPAIVEHHLTAGAGINISKKVSLNVGYMHAFANSIKETSDSTFGGTIKLSSRLSEDSYEFGLNIMF